MIVIYSAWMIQNTDNMRKKTQELHTNTQVLFRISFQLKRDVLSVALSVSNKSASEIDALLQQIPSLKLPAASEPGSHPKGMFS